MICGRREMNISINDTRNLRGTLYSAKMKFNFITHIIPEKRRS